MVISSLKIVIAFHLFSTLCAVPFYYRDSTKKKIAIKYKAKNNFVIVCPLWKGQESRLSKLLLRAHLSSNSLLPLKCVLKCQKNLSKIYFLYSLWNSRSLHWHFVLDIHGKKIWNIIQLSIHHSKDTFLFFPFYNILMGPILESFRLSFLSTS